MAKQRGATEADAEALAALQRFGGAAGGEGEEAEDTPAADPVEESTQREIEFAAPVIKQARVGRLITVEQRPAPRWYRAAVPLLFVVGGVLVVIGVWGVGAMAYMQSVKPAGPEFAVNYPLIRWEQGPVEAEGEGGKWAESSVRMAEMMLLCLPLAGVMGGMVLVMRKGMRAGEY